MVFRTSLDTVLFRAETWPILPTISIQLVWVEGQSAVVLVVGDAIIVVIMVAGVSLAVLVVVSLVGIRDVRAVVQVVLVSVFIDVLVAVTLVSDTVIV